MRHFIAEGQVLFTLEMDVQYSVWFFTGTNCLIDDCIESDIIFVRFCALAHLARLGYVR